MPENKLPISEVSVSETLTPREREIVDALREGLTNREIAERLMIRQMTVKTHLRAVFRKTGTHDRRAFLRKRGR
jgi:DNA-binding NarL/FixJ family response regulator